VGIGEHGNTGLVGDTMIIYTSMASVYIPYTPP
jgi:hypothetical protein